MVVVFFDMSATQHSNVCHRKTMADTKLLDRSGRSGLDHENRLLCRVPHVRQSCLSTVVVERYLREYSAVAVPESFQKNVPHTKSIRLLLYCFVFVFRFSLSIGLNLLFSTERVKVCSLISFFYFVSLISFFSSLGATLANITQVVSALVMGRLSGSGRAEGSEDVMGLAGPVRKF